MDLSSLPQPYVSYPSPGGRRNRRPHAECVNCSVHAGFFRSWESARPVVLSSIEAVRDEIPGVKLHLLGHSLGGAVACLAALELVVSLGWQDVRVTTFGEPRVGNEALSNYINTIFHLDQDDANPQQWRNLHHQARPPPSPSDIRPCAGNAEADCSAGAASPHLGLAPWSPLFAHRDYFHRLGLCLPGGDPADWEDDSVEEL
ncbi:hypothetical protein GQ602_004367 [Ophiocordyceps camponoti-floridani]|uniref:Fungal lipase-type domain-containing protein n=1 Tax=Ophiocordyceps camponoti-floridani TaxID=2030778 RepID=A0A8H4Q6M5_9HYPO|nr:hypothetical protein GQ602_004367 [Ophiocordyceps camponoti-floridani]